MNKGDRAEFSKGESMSEWKNIKLGEIVSIKHGWAFKGEFLTDEGTGNPIVINIGNFKYNGGFRFNETKIKEYSEEFPPEYVLKAGDILLIMTCQTEGGEILGIPGVIPNDKKIYLHNQRLGKVIVKNHANTDQGFLYWYFLTTEFNQQLVGSASGTKIVHTAPSRIEACDISLPPLPEQKAIASILSSLDDKIDLLHRQNKTLEAIAETLFRQWFIEKAQADWEEGTLGDVITIKGGTTPSTKETTYWDGDIYWTSPRDLSSHISVFMFDTERKITAAGLAKIGSGLMPIGTVLMSSRAPIGYLAITDIPVAINQGYIAIVCDKLASNYFMYLWCKTNMEDIKNAGNGSTFEEISKSNFRNLSITIPPKSVLDRFDNIVASEFQKIKTNQQQIKTLEKLRDTLSPKLMSGEVRVEI
jgi:type I restriction enzyme, S subunit